MKARRTIGMATRAAETAKLTKAIAVTKAIKAAITAKIVETVLLPFLNNIFDINIENVNVITNNIE